MSDFFEKAKRLKDNIESFGVAGIGYTIEENIMEELEIPLESIHRLNALVKKNFAKSDDVGDAEVKRRALQPGDVIAVTRKLPYQHFGVYIGDNKVIHFAAKNGDWGGKVTIHEAPFEEFLRDSNTFEILEFEEKRSEAKRYTGLKPMGEAFAGSSITGANISIIPLLVDAIRDVEYHLYSPEETVQRAKMVAEKCEQEGSPFEVFVNGHKYNLVFNNCEHFAIWCKTGVHESRQVNKVLKFISSIPSYILED